MAIESKTSQGKMKRENQETNLNILKQYDEMKWERLKLRMKPNEFLLQKKKKNAPYLQCGQCGVDRTC